MGKKYRLLNWGLPKSDTIKISREQVIEMYNDIKKDKQISGLVCPIDRIVGKNIKEQIVYPRKETKEDK